LSFDQKRINNTYPRGVI